MSGASILKNYFYTLYRVLLKNHVKAQTLKPSQEEEVCVKSFCVLAHAAVEEFIETLCQETLHKAYMKYKSKSILTTLPHDQNDLTKINLGIVQLLETLILASNFALYSTFQSDALKEHKSKLERITQIHKSGNLPSVNDLIELTKTTGSYAKEILKETERFFKGHIESNNGASLKYLLRLLIPVGIDIPNTIEINSLQKLADYRGNYAHTKGFTQIISASDLATYAIDVVKLCSSVEKNVDDFASL